MKTYKELKKLKNFKDRFEYLKLDGTVGADTFGHSRYVNQVFYKSPEWKKVRDDVILRDNGCDLGIEDRQINDLIIVHHINPITMDDILERHPKIFDTDNLICTTKNTHNAIHYSDEESLIILPLERKPNDTIPWK